MSWPKWSEIPTPTISDSDDNATIYKVFARAIGDDKMHKLEEELVSAQAELRALHRDGVAKLSTVELACASLSAALNALQRARADAEKEG